MSIITREFKVKAKGLKFPEGPISMNDGSIILVEIARGTLSKINISGETEVIANLGGGPNGAAIGPDGYCYVCNNGGFEWEISNNKFMRPILESKSYSGGKIQKVNIITGEFSTFMKINYKELLDNNLSVNSYLWPNDRNPFEFIELIIKSRIKNIGLHTDFINNFGVNKLRQELILNKINVTSINSVGYFTDPYYFKQNEKVLQSAKILNPDLVCLITGGVMGGPNPVSNEFT